MATDPLLALHRMARRGKTAWIGVFLKFIDKLRIDSKEVPPEDDRGARLNLWNTQRLALEQIGEGFELDQRMVYVLKGRQGGVSTLLLALLLFWVAVHPRTIAALVTNNEEVRDAFRDTLNRFMASFPVNFFGERFMKVRHNDKQFIFSNGSRIDYLVAGQKKTNWGESRGYSVCLCTEVGSYGTEAGLKSFLEALAQEHPDRLLMFEGTAAGMNHWHDMWYDAEEELTIRRIFLGWWAKEGNTLRRGTPNFRKFGLMPTNGEETKLCNLVHERYGHIVTVEQLAWYRWRSSLSDKQTMEQNQPWLPEQAFVLSGYSFFAMRLLQNRYEYIVSDESGIEFLAYRFIIGNNFWATTLEKITDAARLGECELKVWEEPMTTGQYVIGMDPAYGSGEHADRHCCSVWRCYADKLVQVAEYADNRVQTHQAAWVLGYLAGAYRNCMVNIELGGPGRQVFREFENIRTQLRAEMYQSRNQANDWEDFLTNARYFLYRKVDSPGAGFVYMFETNYRNKFDLMNLTRDLFTQGILEINSVRLIDEMATMVQERSDIAPQAPGKQHDDRVFAAALAARTYYDHVQNGLVQAGASYERVTNEENGIPEGPRALVDRLVYSYFQHAEAAEVDDVPLQDESDMWKRSLGLI